MHKYGREFSIAVMENRDGCVSSRVSLTNQEYYFRLLKYSLKVMSKLSTATPAPELVDAYLREIALAYGVPWGSPDELGSTDTNSSAQKIEGKVRSKPFGSLSQAKKKFAEDIISRMTV
jgi:vacuolar protein sorting-associated protein IST1